MSSATIEPTKYPIPTDELIKADLPSDVPLSTEVSTFATQAEVDALPTGVTLNDPTEVTQPLVSKSEDKAALSGMAKVVADRGEKIIDAATETPPQPGTSSVSEVTTSVESPKEPKLNKHDEAIQRIQAAISAGKSPSIESAYDQSAFAHLQASGWIAEQKAQAARSGSATELDEVLTRATEAARANFPFDATVEDRRGKFGANHGVQHRAGGGIPEVGQKLADTPAVLAVDNDASKEKP